MTNNDVLRRLRFIFDFSDTQMMGLFNAGNYPVTREQVSSWLKHDDRPDFRLLTDRELAIFCNSLIEKKRGKKEGPALEAEATLNNNMIFRKLKIALNYTDEDILAVMILAGFPLGKHELSAFFRKRDHKNYRVCQDQVLRNFLKGLQLKYRGDASEESVNSAE